MRRKFEEETGQTLVKRRIDMHAVIMAGGKGTRLEKITKGEIPKPMVPVAGKALLERQIITLKGMGVSHITMVVGHLKEVILSYFGTGERFGIRIDYIEEKEPLGTAGTFPYLRERIREEYFLLVFGDVLFDIDLKKMEHFFLETKAEALLFAHPNSHPFDSDLLEVNEAGKVLRFDSKHNTRDDWYDNCVNAGIYILRRSVLCLVKDAKKTDLEKDVLSPMAERGEAIYAYRSPEYVKDVGTVERIRQAEADIESGFIEKRNLRNKQRAVFLDRDGVMNECRGFVKREEELVLLPGAIEALRLLNASEYLAIVVTNQPIIARGDASLCELKKIFNKMKTLMGQEGVFVDDIFYCPHHPDRGFLGERTEYKIDCTCRKPKPGMLFQAAKRYNIDLKASWIIGDTTSDVECGRRAGCRTVLVKTGMGGEDCKFQTKPELVCENLKEAVEHILHG